MNKTLDKGTYFWNKRSFWRRVIPGMMVWDLIREELKNYHEKKKK